MQKCVIFDLDGTLFDTSHRIHYIKNKPKNWKAFYEGIRDDPLIEEIAHILKMYHYDGRYNIVYLTGREETYRAITLEAIKEHGLPKAPLYMRPKRDYRPDVEVKKALLEIIRGDGHDPKIAFEDRKRNVDMFRAEGMLVCHVDEGDF